MNNLQQLLSDLIDSSTVIDHKSLIQVEDAIEMIEKAQLEALQPQWVSVEDRLPVDAKPVIVQGGCGHYSHKYKGWFTNMERDNFGEYRPIQWTVTHWQPLPTPPAQGK